nr:tyrosine-type recombinase/integrase [Glycomyces sambucus]
MVTQLFQLGVTGNPESQALSHLKKGEVENLGDLGRKLLGAWHESGLVFTTAFGTPIDPRNFLRSFTRHLTDAGLRKITVHDARRTCSTLLVDLDVHPRVVMAIMRHSDFKVTMEVYAQASDKATREALRKLGDSLGSGEYALL